MTHRQACSLAQLNIARRKFDYDDERFSEFMLALDPVNAAAESAPGFIWRLVSAEDDPDVADFEAQGWLVNMSVWSNPESLLRFVRDSHHLEVMKRRRQWFEQVSVSMCLWWVPDGHIPGFADAMQRLNYLQEHGQTARAFDFRVLFEPDGSAQPTRG